MFFYLPSSGISSCVSTIDMMMCPAIYAALGWALYSGHKDTTYQAYEGIISPHPRPFFSNWVVLKNLDFIGIAMIAFAGNTWKFPWNNDIPATLLPLYKC